MSKLFCSNSQFYAKIIILEQYFVYRFEFLTYLELLLISHCLKSNKLNYYFCKDLKIK